uniref:Uncharacterized protein n=1 Tax=Arundo donax TaxID=35708 RepID=A0A0A9HT31_ARUDO
MENAVWRNTPRHGTRSPLATVTDMLLRRWSWRVVPPATSSEMKLWVDPESRSARSVAPPTGCAPASSRWCRRPRWRGGRSGAPRSPAPRLRRRPRHQPRRAPARRGAGIPCCDRARTSRCSCNTAPGSGVPPSRPWRGA